MNGYDKFTWRTKVYINWKDNIMSKYNLGKSGWRAPIHIPHVSGIWRVIDRYSNRGSHGRGYWAKNLGLKNHKIPS